MNSDPNSIVIDKAEPLRIELTMCPDSILNLPLEILEHILPSLHPAEILKVKEVLPTGQLIPLFID